MKTIARYQPSVDLLSWLNVASPEARIESARMQNVRELGGEAAWPGVLELAYGRQAILLALQTVRASRGAGDVLVPAQICTVVRDAIRMSGLRALYLDGDGRYPTPAATQYAAETSPDVVAAIVAPMYGYVQTDWQPLIDRRQSVSIIVDLAQGLTIGSHLRSLLRNADAVIYSFGLGKGLDTGGGVLLSKQEIPEVKRENVLGSAVAFARAAALRTLIASGAYRALNRRIQAAGEAEKDDIRTFEPRRLPAAMHAVWRARLTRFAGEVEVARARAIELGSNRQVRDVARDLDLYTAPEAIHLRQVIRCGDAARRDDIVASLVRSGIDCAPAGEPLPPGDYPNARTFGADAIRLPFLGRLTTAQFKHLKAAWAGASA